MILLFVLVVLKMWWLWLPPAIGLYFLARSESKEVLEVEGCTDITIEGETEDEIVA